jgi:hypothetical protein
VQYHDSGNFLAAHCTMLLRKLWWLGHSNKGLIEVTEKVLQKHGRRSVSQEIPFPLCNLKDLYWVHRKVRWMLANILNSEFFPPTNSERTSDRRVLTLSNFYSTEQVRHFNFPSTSWSHSSTWALSHSASTGRISAIFIMPFVKIWEIYLWRCSCIRIQLSN